MKGRVGKSPVLRVEQSSRVGRMQCDTKSSYMEGKYFEFYFFQILTVIVLGN